MRYEFHPEALAEYKEGAEFYPHQQPGLDLWLIICVEKVSHSRRPIGWRPFEEDVRRSLPDEQSIP